MATEIAKAYVQIIPSAEGISGSITEVLSGEAQSAGQSSGKKFSSSFGGAIGTGLKVAGGAAAVAGTALAGLGASIVSNAKDTAAFGDNIDKLSQKIGISAESFQEWDYVFSQNGADIGILESGMKKLAGTLDDAQNGSEGAVEKFEALGLSLEDIAGLSQEDLFGKVIESLQEMPEGVERTAAASDLLGKSAMELGPLLNQSAEDTEALKQKAHELGMVMSDDAVKASAGFTDAMDNMGRAMDGAKNTIVSSLLPGLTDITNGFADLVAGNDNATEEIKSGFESLGESVVQAIPSIVDGFTSIVGAVAEIAPEIISSLGTGILDALPTLMGDITAALPQIIEAFLQLLPQLVDVGLQIIVQLALGIADSLPELVPTIVDVVMQIIQVLVDNIPLLLDAGIQLILGLAEGLVNAIPDLVDHIPEIIEALVTALVQGIPALIQGAIQLTMGIVQHLPEIIQALIDAIPEIITALSAAFSDPSSVIQMVLGFSQLFFQIALQAPQIIAGLVQAIPQMITAIVDAFAALAPALVTYFSETFDSLKTTFGKISSHAKEAWKGVKDAFANVKTYFSQKFNDGVSAIKNAFSGIKSYFTSVWNNICSVFSDALKKFGDIGKNIVEGLKAGIEGAWDSLKGWVGDKVSGLISKAKESIGNVFGGDEEEQSAEASSGSSEVKSSLSSLGNALKGMAERTLSSTITATADTVNSYTYTPGYVNSNNNEVAELLARYLPIIADKDTTVEIRQNSQGVFNMVRDANIKFQTATGYHALA